MGTSLARSTPPTGTWRRTPTSASERCSMPTISGRHRRGLPRARRFEVPHPNAAVVAILGSRGHDAHLLPVPLDRLPHLQLVVESGQGSFGWVAVNVNDVVEGVCH